MRIYQNFTESFNEITRDLKEMGIEVHTKSVQDIQGDFETLELQNYQYLVTKPLIEDIPAKDPQWCLEEFSERVSPKYQNPGLAWELRKEYWLPFLHHGQFSYTYNETMAWSVPSVLAELKRDPASRRAFIPVFDANRDYNNLRENQRIPCSIGYWVYIRRGELHLTYLQRSSDFFTHFANDVCLAVLLQDFLAQDLRVKMGTFSHWLGSLHVFSQDVKHVF
jgi:thymidylate synthase